jgi:hypothetical protein
VIVMVFISITHYAHLPAFWPIPSMFLGAVAAASAIGFINMVGNLGGYFGPNMVGKAATDDINWLTQLVDSDRRAERFMPTAEAKPLWTSLTKATTVDEIRAIRNSAVLPSDKQLSETETKRIAAIETNLDEGGKLAADKALQAERLLTAVALRIQLSDTESQQLSSLLTQGASFANGLRWLAPWPIMSAVIILIVGYSRRRAAVTA